MRVSKLCPYCARSNVAGCNLNKNIYSEYPCYDFIAKILPNAQKEKIEMQESRYRLLCPSCYFYNILCCECRAGRSLNSKLECFDYKLSRILRNKKEESEMEDPKYFVFNPKKGLPKQPHATLIEAENEARRIADLEPDTEILVVRVVLGITKPSKQFIYRNYKK